MAGSQVSQIEDQVSHGVIVILKRRRNGKALPLIKETEENAASRRFSGFVDQSELPPSQRRGHTQIHPFALGPIFAASADLRIIPFGLRIGGQPTSELIEMSQHE